MDARYGVPEEVEGDGEADEEEWIGVRYELSGPASDRRALQPYPSVERAEKPSDRRKDNVHAAPGV